MIVSPGRRYIFVHIPKTGGTAMAQALEARAMKDDILVGDTPKALRRKRRLQGGETAGRLWKHSTLAEAEGLYARHELEGYFIFTLVRNPWDRMVSYYHWLRVQAFAHPAVGLAQRLGFAEFVAHPETQAAIRATPASRYMRDGAGEERASCYLRLEHLAADMAPLEAHLGFRPEMGRANASLREADYRVYYDAGTAELVGELCAEDVARFGYSF
ncbi:Type II secretory pathway, pullulanase PulA [Aquicoccus sp. SCR17]|nr:Type II secretory pathway, pullulanase PulA [Carideicomes alvinocaridis]